MTPDRGIRRRVEVAVFVAYVLWCLLAIAEIVGRKVAGSSPLPGILADHNGNIAVSGFIMPFGMFAGFVRQGMRSQPRLARIVAYGIVAAASGSWTTFFVVMEYIDVYGPNHRDLGDVPASLFGAFCGTYAAVRSVAKAAPRGARLPRHPRPQQPS